MESGVRALAADHRGGIWAGLTRAGLFQREKGIWKRMDAPGILPQGRVSALAVDAEDTVWIGTPGAGLFRLKDGVYCRFDPEKTGLPRVVASITEDDAGYFWMGSTEGIFRIKRTDLNSWAAGTKVELRPSRYDRSDGLGTSECAMNVQPTVWRARDGRLWFATRKGLAVVDPREVRADTPPPPVLIEEAVLWGNPKKTVSLGAPDSSNEGKPPSIRVPPATRLMEIHYTAPSFSAPERVRFRYRLEGADPNWTEAGERRVAYYQGLSPGSYRFRVSACNVDGEWNENGADLAFVIEPHPWQTWWFRAALLAGVVGAAALAYNLRVERIKALNRLRLRIAGDLHDEIGANLGSISLNAQLLQRNPSLTSAARDEVTGLHRVAVQTAQAVRDLVWLTNPDFDNSTDMIRRMREVMNLQLPGRERKFDATGVTPDRPLSPEFRRNLFSVFKEALHNVAKHSGAASVEVKLRDTADGLEMTVADNGCGYRPDDIEEGHGLGSMRRRAAEMRGVLEVTSSPGKGTTITLTVAFEQPRRGWRAAGRQTTGIRGIQDPSEPPR
jgi:signal transduction histidine kinase